MKPPGKTVVDEFYIHLSALENVDSENARSAIKRAMSGMPDSDDVRPNVAKFNLRTGRVSLLAYSDFVESPFPELAAAWIFPPDANAPASYRRYDDSLNPPILHRKELLMPASHPNRARWSALTAAAESLGLFDDVATIGFRVNWERLIASKGYRLLGDQFVPLGNAADEGGFFEVADTTLPVQRHLTALSRNSLSAPVQFLIRHRLLGAAETFFDYGCGKGGDISALSAEGYDAKGWDPHYAPDAPRTSADIVNLGFVINVIDDPAERVEALVGAFRLARIVLCVGVMLQGSDPPGRPFRDGFLTSRNTFQKYFSQAELKDYLEQVLHRSAHMIGPGVAFVFADNEAEQRFSMNRYRSRGLAARLLATRTFRVKPVREVNQLRTPHESKHSSAELRFAVARPVLDRLWADALDLGRFPEPEEVPYLADVQEQTRSLANARRMISAHYDRSLLEAAAKTRTDDVQLLMATQQFSRRPAYRELEPSLQRDIKTFFGSYKSALSAGLQLLLDAADRSKVLAASKEAAERGLGWLNGEHSLQLHVSMVDRLPAVLRAYVACGLILWDSLSEVQLVKVHIGSGKLTLMEFEDFDQTPTPLLRRRIKVQVRRLNYEVFEYGSTAYPKPVLYRKSRYLNEAYPGYAEQLAFDEELERLGIPEADDYGPLRNMLVDLLEAKRRSISGMRLVRSESIPDLDNQCGANFSYRDFIECGETQARIRVPNVPRCPATYNALYDLATELLDPLIEYFGAIRLTYGFASAGLTKYIAHGIAPKLDQHSACEHNARGFPICDRGGAACDLLVDDEDMQNVANWIIGNLPFDRLYFYGPNRPIHLSYKPSPAKIAFMMTQMPSGRLMPRRYIPATNSN